MFLLLVIFLFVFFFFFNDTATTEIYTLSLHDALPIYDPPALQPVQVEGVQRVAHLPQHEVGRVHDVVDGSLRSEEHTSELQSPCNLVCRLLLEKKKKTTYQYRINKMK